MTNKKWNWQQPDWPHFTYDAQKIAPLEEQLTLGTGMLFGAFQHLDPENKDALKVDIISEEAFKTSEIEGEYLDRYSLQSSIARQFGLKVTPRAIRPAEKGIADLMITLYQTFETPLTDEMLFEWHKFVVAGRADLETIGAYRAHPEAMQVISGPEYDPTIHFVAPPSEAIPHEMQGFVDWFNDSQTGGKRYLSPITRAAIAHLYFLCIHPFEDGNGRIARAISEKALAQHYKKPTLITLAYIIQKKKKAYYDALAIANQKNEVTEWILYFGQTILEAQAFTQQRIEFLIQKTKLFDRVRGLLNARQEKAIDRLFRAGPEGFEGGLSAENYRSITKATRPTATRDLQDLVEKKILKQTGERRYTRYYLNLN